MFFPLVIRERLTAVINIGTRIDGEDYDSEELQILNNYSPQLAIASENLRLLEENFDKKRMEQELASARDTQKGLLPQEIPDCPGLALAAVCHFCLEVAGDYYDVVPLADGKTCLAIGDVSGKGASASLLMASLQSSLNTAIPFGIPLSEIVGRINAVVYRNTSSDQFITFFIGIFDPKTKTLIYVNAGHDVPFVLRTDGSMEFLEKGGVILGCVPEWAYEEGAVQLSEGDTVLLYTDGVREAWNADEEEFGVERIQEILIATLTRTPSEQVAQIEEEVVRFHGGSRFDDDFTLLVARVS
ncbi:MAG: SpoIIE family protein phosphatase [bacterium]|nr:SpoIIE family protein phosphatase [bacterium]